MHIGIGRGAKTLRVGITGAWTHSNGDPWA